jgi:hypothetical protein
MGYWKYSKKSVAYKSKILWWQCYRSAAKFYSFGFAWSPRQKMFMIHLGRWQMNFIWVFLQKEHKIETL